MDDNIHQAGADHGIDDSQKVNEGREPDDHGIGVEHPEEQDLGNEEKHQDPHQGPETPHKVIIADKEPVNDQPGTKKESDVHKDNHPIWSGSP